MAGKEKERVGPGEVIRSLEPGQFVTLAKCLPHGGSLQARKLQAGAVQFYWRALFRADAEPHNQTFSNDKARRSGHCGAVAG